MVAFKTRMKCVLLTAFGTAMNAQCLQNGVIMNDSFKKWLDSVEMGHILLSFLNHVIVIRLEGGAKEYIGQLVDIDRDFCTIENLKGQRTAIRSKHIIAVSDH